MNLPAWVLTLDNFGELLNFTAFRTDEMSTLGGLRTSNTAASRHRFKRASERGDWLGSGTHRERRQNGKSGTVRKAGSETRERRGRGTISRSRTRHGQPGDYNSRVVRAAIEPLSFRNLRRF